MHEHESPIIVVTDGQSIRITETSHEQIIARVRGWMDGLTLAPGQDVNMLHDRYRMAEATIALVETDRMTGISLEQFGPVADLVSRVVAYASGYDPAYTTVHWVMN